MIFDYNNSNIHRPYGENTQWAQSTIPGVDTQNPLLNVLIGIMAQQGIFPQPQGTQSIFDMQRARQRTLDMHYIMRRATASSQMVQRMGGINMDSQIYKTLYPFIAMPDGPFWKAMAPLIGGNPVKAQMGLYADLNGQSMAMTGRMGGISAFETDRMMDQLSGRFYNPADFDRYRVSVEPDMRKALGNERYDRLAANWTPEGIRGMEGEGYTGVNRDMGDLLERQARLIQSIKDKTGTSEASKAADIAKIKREAEEAAHVFLAKVSNPEAQEKISKAFTGALESDASKAAIAKFRERWSPDRQDAFGQAERGVDVRTGKVPGGIDYRFTRGFNLEDITGSFGRAAATGLVGKKTGLDITGFGESAIPALDAARDIFGRDLSGRQLIDEMSKLVGSGYLNLSSNVDSGKMEELLRRVKATARAAGIQIEAMRGIIDEQNMLVMNNRDLPFGVSGLTTANMATEATMAVTAAIPFMDPNRMRLLGGAVGMTQGLLMANNESISEPITQNIAALYHRANLIGSEEAKSMILDYAKTGDHTAIGQTAFIRRVAPSLDMTPVGAMYYASENTLAASMGLDAAGGQLNNLGLDTRMATVFQGMDAMSLGGAGTGTMSKILGFVMDAGNDTKSEQDLLAAIPGAPQVAQEAAKALWEKAREKRKTNAGNLLLSDIAGIVGYNDASYGNLVAELTKNGGDLSLLQRYDPKAREAEATMKAWRTKSAKIDAKIARALPHLNVGLPQRGMQALFEGKFDREGFEAIKNVLSGGPDVAGYNAMANSLNEAYTTMDKVNPTEDEVDEWIKTAPSDVLNNVFKRAMADPNADLTNLTTVGGKAGAQALRVIGRDQAGISGVLDSLGKGPTTNAEILTKLAKYPEYSGALASFIAELKSDPTAAVPAERLGLMKDRISNNIEAHGITPEINQLIKNKGLSQSEHDVRRAITDLRNIEAFGNNYNSPFTEQGLVQSRMTGLRTWADVGAASSEKTKRLVDILEILGERGTSSETEGRRLKAIKDLNPGLEGIDELARLGPKIDISTMRDIAGKADPDVAKIQAKAALGAAKMATTPDEVAALLQASKAALKLDPDRGLAEGKHSITDYIPSQRKKAGVELNEELMLPAAKNFSNRAIEELTTRLAGAGSATPDAKRGDVNKVIADLKVYGGPEAPFKQISKAYTDPINTKDKDYLNKIVADFEGGEKILNEVVGSYETQMADYKQGAVPPKSPMALDLQGVITAIGELKDMLRTVGGLNP